MIKAVKIFGTLLLVFFTISLSANDFGLYVTQNAEKSLVFRATSTKALTMRLMDKDHGAVFSERIPGETNYLKRLDLAGLASGTYYLSVIGDADLSEVVYTVVLDRSKVAIVDRRQQARPHFKINGGRISLNYLNPDKSKVVLKVLDDNNEVLYKEVLRNEINVGKLMDFGLSHPGSYIAVLEDNGVSYYSPNIEVE